jgi:hypothetical protein
MIFEAAHWLGIIPLLCLAVLAWRQERRDRAWWLLAVSFGVSFVADSLAHMLPREAPSNAYPVLQSALAALVLTDLSTALIVIGLIVIAAVTTAFLQNDLLLFTVAGLSIASIVWLFRTLPHLLRYSLLIGFGGGVVAWWVYSLDPGWTGWIAFQSTRLIAIVLFCLAALRPRLAVVR